MSGRQLRRRRCELIAIGTELTVGFRTDSNTVWLRRRLADLAIDVARIHIVPDDEKEVRDVFREGLARAGLILATGGLGPTEDDRTMAALCAALGRPVRRHAATEARLRERAAQLRRPLSAEVAQMAHIPEGAEVLPNERGAAPGILVEEGDAWIVVLPGVPDEMKGIVDAHLLSRLEARFGRRAAARRTVRLGGMWESDADRRAAPLCARHGVDLTTLAQAGEVELHVAGPAGAVESACSALAAEFGDDMVSVDDRSLEEVALDEVRRRGGTLAVAESCTGGRVAARLTSVPGSSAVFVRGYVTYADEAKVDLLAVPAELLRREGAVSEAAVRAMVAGLTRDDGRRWGLAVSGIAGPSGGSREKPVGTVWFAAGGPGAVRCRRVLLSGGRARIQEQAAGIALDQLRRALLAGPAGAAPGRPPEGEEVRE